MAGKIKIESKTTFTPIRKDGYYKPLSSEFIFRNSGNTMIYVSGMPVAPGDVFGRSVDTIVGMAAVAGLEIELNETTEYEVRIGTTVAPGYQTAYAGPATPDPVMLCTLIQTEYKIIK